MSVKNSKQLEALKKTGRLVAETLRIMQINAKPGVTTGYLDRIARMYFESRGARSAPEKDYRFPGATCISVNEEVAHGIPGARILKKGDLLNLDVSLELNGYYADAGITLVVGGSETDFKKGKLIRSSEEILQAALTSVKAGMPLSSIGFLIESMANNQGYKVIRNLAGHGIGRRLHEYPDHILNYGDPSDRRVLTKGLVIAVETFISEKSEYTVQQNDGWTLQCPDRSLVAQFEHTVVVTENEPVILTQLCA